MSASFAFRAVEFVYWVVALTLGIVAVALGFGLLAGLGGARALVTTKKVLFVVGFLLFAVGAFALKPESPHDDAGAAERESAERESAERESAERESDEESDGRATEQRAGASGLAAESPEEAERSVLEEEWFIDLAVQKLPPLRSHPVPFDQRVGRLLKMFVAGVLVLAISIYMEVGLGVTGT